VSTGTIVVGVDGSHCSDVAVAKAVELAAGLGDTLVVVYAVEPPFRGVGDEWKESQQALEDLGAPIVDQAVARAEEAGVKAEPALVPKRPAEALLEVAEERSARLIVVGTASEHPLTGVILGSVPHKLVHRSTIPVLVVPVPDAG
jgi:nucleotide-binding universal stress UspA family protein